MAGQSRFFLTEKSKIASNIESGVINESDFIITSDTHELYFVKEDGTYFAITTVQDSSGEGGYVRGNSTGTTRNHVAVWGDNGFEIKDSGYTIASNVPINAKFTDTTYSPATTLLSGLMSKDDKAKLDGINVDAIKTQLQSLYVKLGGDSSETASSIEDWIDKIEDVAGSGNSGGIFYVQASYDGSTYSGEFECETTVEEIVNAINNDNKVVILYARDVSNNSVFRFIPIFSISASEYGYVITFSHALSPYPTANNSFIFVSYDFVISNVPMAEHYYSYKTTVVKVNGEQFQ